MSSTKQERKFPLAGMDAHLLEKIITKMDAKSYIQMQQTCHDMKDFIEQRINMKGVHVEGKFEVERSVNCGWTMYYMMKTGRILNTQSIVKSIKVETKDTEQILAMAKVLLPVFSDVYIYYNCENVDYPDSARDIAMTGINRRVLDCFFSMNCPHLKQFTFVVARYEDKEDDGRNNSLNLALPKHFPDGATMKQITGGRGDDSFCKISYHRN